MSSTSSSSNDVVNEVECFKICGRAVRKTHLVENLNEKEAAHRKLRPKSRMF